MNKALSRPARSGTCTICAHSEVGRIELLAAGGAAYAPVARKFALGVHSLRRHMRHHVSDARRAALVVGPVATMELAARISEESQSILDHHKVTRAGLYAGFSAAVDAGDRTSMAMLGRVLTEVNNSIGRLTGELASSPLVTHQTLNVMMQSPQVAAFMEELAKQLTPFPDALRAVVGWLEQREAHTLDAVNRTPALEHHP